MGRNISPGPEARAGGAGCTTSFADVSHRAGGAGDGQDERCRVGAGLGADSVSFPAGDDHDLQEDVLPCDGGWVPLAGSVETRTGLTDRQEDTHELPGVLELRHEPRIAGRLQLAAAVRAEVLHAALLSAEIGRASCRDRAE